MYLLKELNTKQEFEKGIIFSPAFQSLLRISPFSYFEDIKL